MILYENLAAFGSWTLTLADERELPARDFAPATVSAVRGSGFLTVPATVPGNFELDLCAAGVEPDPYFAQNPFLYQKYEASHLWYATEFSYKGPVADDLYLIFEGIDTIADVYLNGSLIGHTENMLIEHELPAGGAIREGKNELVVHIFPSVVAARKYPARAEMLAQRYNYESLYLRKSGSMFGWDIMPRFVSGGIWKPVSLVRKPAERIEQVYLTTRSVNADRTLASLDLFYEIATEAVVLRGEDLQLRVDLVCGASELHTTVKPWFTFGHARIRLPDPVLWFPKNAGDPALYDLTVTYLRNGKVCDVVRQRVGIRTVALERTSLTDADGNGEFVFRINGQKIFCLGTNWVPLDAFPSRFAERLPQALKLLDESGCNMVRCWGGNAYESDAFFDHCDENGILVWQDFCMACGIYPQDDAFAAALSAEAEAVVKRLRRHPSLALWAGNNECDDSFSSCFIDPNTDRTTREVLPRVLRDHDPARPYLPSSPYVDETAYRAGQAYLKGKRRAISEEHLWGPRDDFKGAFYSNSICHFASETGYHGCPSPASLKKYISADQLWPICREPGVPGDDWICHAAEAEPGMEGPYSYRIGLMIRQVGFLFGDPADDLNDFARQSQISQAEAFKYFIERFRLSKWRRTGILWWNLIDGWPQISDAVVDWYGCKKLAFRFIQRSQAPVFMAVDEPKNGVCALRAVNDTGTDRDLTYTVRDLTEGRELASGKVTAAADASVLAAGLPALDGYHFLLLEWESADGARGSNHFVTALRGISYEKYLADLKKAGYDQFEGFDD